MKKFAFLLAISVALPSIASAEEYLYILSARAQLLANPAFGSQTISNMTKGEKVITLDKTNNWFKVEYEGKQGWLSRLSVSPHPPVKRSKRLAEVDEKLMDNSRRRASNVSTTAAVRGLRNMEGSNLDSKDAMNFAALEQMENIDITDAEVFAFMDDISQ